MVVDIIPQRVQALYSSLIELDLSKMSKASLKIFQTEQLKNKQRGRRPWLHCPKLIVEILFIMLRM